jgi:hypothetical protein
VAPGELHNSIFRLPSGVRNKAVKAFCLRDGSLNTEIHKSPLLINFILLLFRLFQLSLRRNSTCTPVGDSGRLSCDFSFSTPAKYSSWRAKPVCGLFGERLGFCVRSGAVVNSPRSSCFCSRWSTLRQKFARILTYIPLIGSGDIAVSSNRDQSTAC